MVKTIKLKSDFIQSKLMESLPIKQDLVIGFLNINYVEVDLNNSFNITFFGNVEVKGYKKEFSLFSSGQLNLKNNKLYFEPVSFDLNFSEDTNLFALVSSFFNSNKESIKNKIFEILKNLLKNIALIDLNNQGLLYKHIKDISIFQNELIVSISVISLLLYIFFLSISTIMVLSFFIYFSLK